MPSVPAFTNLPFMSGIISVVPASRSRSQPFSMSFPSASVLPERATITCPFWSRPTVTRPTGGVDAFVDPLFAQRQGRDDRLARSEGDAARSHQTHQGRD